MHQPDTHNPAAWADEAEPLLDAALSRVLQPPCLPAGFEARLRAAVLRETADALQAQRSALQAEHAAQRHALQRNLAAHSRHALALVAAAAFCAGALATWALPWLQATLGVEAGLLMPSLALGAGALVGLGHWAWRSGALQSWR